MNMKTLILGTVLAGTVLAIGAHSAGAYSRGKEGSARSPSPQSQDQPSTRLTTVEEQRSLLRHCLVTAELAGHHMQELVHSATRGRLNRNEIQQHLREVRSAVDSMFEDHRRLLYGLSGNQWQSAREPITRLEQLRASIQAQLDGTDLELQMPDPDPKVFARYGKRMRASLQDWRKQHRKMGTAIGTKL